MSKRLPNKIIQENQKIYDEYFDEDFAVSMVETVGLALDKTYFRSVLVGFENLPKRNNPDVPLIFAGNHSGMAFPWDGMVLGARFLEQANGSYQNAFRPIAAPLLSKTKLMNPYMIPNFWKKTGCVDAYFKNFETMMFYQKSNVLVFPEGVPGIGKGFNRKYQLQRFSSSFIYMSLKYKTDIVPILTINGEYINPYSYSSNWLNRLVQKIGISFLPISPILILMLIQPWVFYMAFPAKLTYLMGKRIKYKELTDKNFEDLSKAELREIAENVRQIMQKQLDEGVLKYGQKPYRLGEFFKTLFQNWKFFPFSIPPAWPLLFAEFEQKYKLVEKSKKPLKLELNFFSAFRILFQNPILICYFIPIIGWIPLLIKGYWGNRL